MISKRGTKYHFNTTLSGRRLRCSLGVSDPRAASRLETRINFAISEGPKSEVWSSLALVLPQASYQIISSAIGLTASPNLIEFEVLFEKHLDTRLKLSEITESTHELYSRTAEIFFTRMVELGIQKLEELTPSVIEDYLVWRSEGIKSKGRSGRGVVTECKVLVQVFDLGIRDGLLKTSPLKYKYRADSDPKGPDPFSEDELDRLESVVEGKERLAFMLLRWTGLRKSDASTVTWNAIDWEKESLMWKTKKRHKYVTIPLSVRLMDELRIYKGEPDAKILPWAQNKLYQIVVSWGKKAEVENCHPHRFRSSFVCYLLGKGASLWDVSQMIGDSHSVVEKYYAQISNGQQERVRGILKSA